jgi:predicted heme/steroid binding protein
MSEKLSGIPTFSDESDYSGTHAKLFTKEELFRCDGKDGAPAYVAYKERIYDVSQSFHWKNRRHQAMHSAGEDLTSSLTKAPHGENLLESVTIIGTLVSG